MLHLSSSSASSRVQDWALELARWQVSAARSTSEISPVTAVSMPARQALWSLPLLFNIGL